MELFPVVILAGGLATRLRPLTEKIPKALLDIHGEPFISHQLRLLKNQGIKEVILCIGYLGEMLQQFVENHDYGLKVKFNFDGDTLLGTAGAINKALHLLPENFFVLYGDSYLPCDFRAVQKTFIRANKPGLMTVYHNNGKWDSSNVIYTGSEIKIYDKINRTPTMQYIDYGLGILNKKAFKHLPNHGIYDLAHLYQDLLIKNQLAAHEVKERFYEIGSLAGIEELSSYLDLRKLTLAKKFNDKEYNMEFIQQFLKEATQIIEKIDILQIEKSVDLLSQTKDHGGRLFVLGVGGSAGNASHAVNDFRKIVGIEAYAPTDNVSELTARTNDDGWATVFSKWLEVSKLKNKDTLLILSVGGGNLEKNVSPNLVAALEYAKKVGAKVIGIVGRDGGHTAKVADACVIIPTINSDNITPHAEAFQAVIWHLFVSHPKLKLMQTKWESVATATAI